MRTHPNGCHPEADLAGHEWRHPEAVEIVKLLSEVAGRARRLHRKLAGHECKPRDGHCDDCTLRLMLKELQGPVLYHAWDLTDNLEPAKEMA